MFEIPEVETVKRDLDRDLVGKKVKEAEAMSMKTLGRYKNRKAFTSQLEGMKILGVERKGLYITIVLDGDSTLVVDLGSTGSLRRNANKDAVESDTEIVITFTQHGQLRLLDSGNSAQAFVVDTDALADELPELDGYGLDPVDEPVSWTAFGRSLLQHQTKLKTLLTDSSFVVGIDDIYADEILYHAGLRHDRLSDSLSSQEIRRLHRAVVGTLHDAIKYRGTSVESRPFIDPFGQPGEYAEHLEVWGKHGQLSGRSRLPIQRVKFGGSWTYYCDTQV
ncbi:MAG: DNA-formamidopyrimidine glycosylase family protein [Acidimicrobiales bacterium]|nr:DNA-formamidopyrimidine glycosylase family protein [Acidimicrobiales bacterium]